LFINENTPNHASKILQLQEDHMLEREKMMTEESNDNQEEIRQLKTKIKELNDLNKHNLQRFEIEHARNTGLRNAARLLNPPALRPIIQHGNPIQSKVSKTPQLEGNYKTYAKQVEDSYENFKKRSPQLRIDLITLGLHEALTDKILENAVKEAVDAAQVDEADERRQKEVRINVIRKLCWEFKKLCKETLENTVTGTTANQGKKKEAATRVASFLKTKFLVPENEHKEEDEPVPLGRQEVDSPDDNRESDSPDSPHSAVPSSSSSSDENLHGEDRSSQLPNESNFSFSKGPTRPNDAGETELPEHVRAHLGFRPNPPKTVHFYHEGMEEFENEEQDSRFAAEKQQMLARSKEKNRAKLLNSKRQSVNANPYMLSPHVCFKA